MGLVAKQKDAGGAPVEPGSWPAVCVGYADLGTQSSTFDGQAVVAEKVLIFWDIPDQRIAWQGKDMPRRISARYTLSLGAKANLRKVLEAWRGKEFTSAELAGFDLDKLIGAPCLLNITHRPRKDGGVFGAVSTIMALPRGMPTPHMEVEPVRYLCRNETTGEFVLPGEAIPPWVREIIAESREAKQAGWTYRREHGESAAATVASTPAPVPVVEDDDIPF